MTYQPINISTFHTSTGQLINSSTFIDQRCKFLLVKKYISFLIFISAPQIMLPALSEKNASSRFSIKLKMTQQKFLLSATSLISGMSTELLFQKGMFEF